MDAPEAKKGDQSRNDREDSPRSSYMGRTGFELDVTYVVGKLEELPAILMYG